MGWFKAVLNPESRAQLARGFSKKDNLQRASIVAMGAAWADRAASTEEEAAAKSAIDDTFKATFDQRTINEALDGAHTLFARNKFSSMGRLEDACRQSEGPEESRMLFLLACDVCAAEGKEDEGIGEAEKKYLLKIAGWLGIKASDYITV
jgi:tellurite resistance protein